MTRISFQALALTLVLIGCEDRTPFRDDRPMEDVRRGLKATGKDMEGGAKNLGEAIEDGAQNVAAEVDDVGLTMSVKTALVAAEDLKAVGITVRSENGVVSLTGSVPTSGQKSRAADIARDVKGVLRVKNQLDVHEG